MSAQPTHDLAVKNGEYQDHNGETKGRWVRIGTVFRHDDGGTSIKLDCLPVGIPDWNGWVSVFKREPKGDAPPPKTPHAAPPPAREPSRRAPPPSQMPFDDDIPF